MTARRSQLIADLVGDLKPVTRPGRTGGALAAWLAVATAYSALIVFLTAPPRAGAFTSLLAVPSYGIEIVLALAVIVLFAWGALRTAVPSGNPWRLNVTLPAVALGAWVALLVGGLVTEPALATAMLGKREHCFAQTVLFSLPSGALLLFIARGYLPLWPRPTGAMIGAAAAALPAAMMQLGCMYEPGHALAYHLSGIPIVAALGALLGPLVLRRRVNVRRSRGHVRH